MAPRRLKIVSWTLVDYRLIINIPMYYVDRKMGGGGNASSVTVELTLHRRIHLSRQYKKNADCTAVDRFQAGGQGQMLASTLYRTAKGSTLKYIYILCSSA